MGGSAAQSFAQLPIQINIKSPNLDSLTAAADRVRSFLANRGHGIGLRLAIKRTGCSGYAYVVNYAEDVGPGDTVGVAAAWSLARSGDGRATTTLRRLARVGPWPSYSPSAMRSCFATLASLVERCPIYDLEFAPTPDVWETLARRPHGGE